MNQIEEAVYASTDHAPLPTVLRKGSHTIRGTHALARVKAVAGEQLAADGAAALLLRAVAREFGIAVPTCTATTPTETT